MLRVLLVFLALLFAPYDSRAADIESIKNELASEDRTTRIDALTDSGSLPEIPASLVEPIASAMRRDIEATFTAKGAKAKEKGGKLVDSDKFKLPTNEDDTTIARIKTDAGSFYEKEFNLVVGLTISSIYDDRIGYTSILFNACNLDQFSALGLTVGDSSGRAYFPRDFGLGLAERVASGLEDGATHQIARVKCTIRSKRVRSHPEDELEILDFQLFNFDKNRWEPWAFGGIEAALKALKRAKNPGADKLADILSDPKMYASATLDGFVRKSAANFLGNMDLDQATKDEIAGKIKARDASFDKSSEYGKVAVAECNRLALVFQPPKVAKATPNEKIVDMASRASTLLQSARNLEKSGKAKAALETYRRISKDFPDTPSAKLATERIKAIEGK